MTRRLVCGIVSGLLAGCAGDASRGEASRDVCPPGIAVTQALRRAPAGWESAQKDSVALLASVSIFDGHPREKADLVPDSISDAGGRRVSTWLLRENDRRGHWIACSYDRSSVVLSRMIAPGVTVAEVTYDLSVTVGGMPEVLKVVLR